MFERYQDDKNALKHWKYIKREKVNGKWRYYYDTSSLKKDFKNVTGIGLKKDMGVYQEQMVSNAKLRNEAIANERNAYKKYEEANSNFEKSRDTIDRINRTKFKKEDLDKEADELWNEKKQLADETLNISVYGADDKTRAEHIKKKAEHKNKEYVAGLKREWEKRDSKELSKANRSLTVSSARMKVYAESGKRYAAEALQYSEKIANAKNKYDTTKSVYDRSLLGRIEKAGDWFKNLFK